MDAEQAKALRAPFPKEAIGKLPKPTKKDNPKGKCDVCGKVHGLPAVHLDYVGHAATTDRLLQVDPEWTWEPMAVGQNGEPLMTNGGLWIKLTVCGITRPGFGDGDSPKEIIGDAIRNAAMRFGVALDLWAKEDLGAGHEGRKEESEPELVPPHIPDEDVIAREQQLLGLADDLGAHDKTEEAMHRHRESEPRRDYMGWLENAILRAEKKLLDAKGSQFKAPDKVGAK